MEPSPDESAPGALNQAEDLTDQAGVGALRAPGVQRTVPRPGREAVDPTPKRTCSHQVRLRKPHRPLDPVRRVEEGHDMGGAFRVGPWDWLKPANWLVRVGSDHGCLQDHHRGPPIPLAPAHPDLPTTIAAGGFYTERPPEPPCKPWLLGSGAPMHSTGMVM